MVLHRLAWVALGLWLNTTPVLAAAPAVGTDDWLIMHDYAEWISTQHAGAVYCCTVADGRPAPARMAGDHWQVYVSSKQFEGAPDDWMDVPEARVLHSANPVGVPIVWYLRGIVLCFAPASAA